MSLVKYNDLLKFTDTVDSDNLEDKLLAAGVKDPDEAIAFFEKNKISETVEPVFVDNEDTVSIFFEVRSYPESFDNPLGDEDDNYVFFKEFSSVDERDRFMQKAKKNSVYLVEKYSHSAVHFSLSRTGDYPDRRWDVTPDCAVLELSDDAKNVRKALYKKHGEMEGEALFKKQLNELLDKYSSYRNGYAYQSVEMEVDKETGDVQDSYSHLSFSQDDFKDEFVYTVQSVFLKKEKDNIKNAFVNITEDKDSFKGFDNNIVRKNSIGSSVFKYESENGLETKIAFVKFENKVVVYTKTPYGSGEGSKNKEETYLLGEFSDHYIQSRLQGLAHTIAVGEFNENAKSYSVDDTKKPKVRM